MAIMERGHARSRSGEALGECGRHVTPIRTRAGCATVFWSGSRGQGNNTDQDRTVAEANMEITRTKRALTTSVAREVEGSGA